MTHDLTSDYSHKSSVCGLQCFVNELLVRFFGERLINGGTWSAQSPDLTGLIFLIGHLKKHDIQDAFTSFKLSEL